MVALGVPARPGGAYRRPLARAPAQRVRRVATV